MKLESKTETYQLTHRTLRITREENDRLVAAIASALVGPDKQMDVSWAEPLIRSISVEVQWLDRQTGRDHLIPVSGPDSFWWQRKRVWGASTTVPVLLEGEEERIGEERRT